MLEFVPAFDMMNELSSTGRLVNNEHLRSARSLEDTNHPSPMSRAWCAFDTTCLDVARRPAAVEVSGLWYYLLAINIAVPRTGIEAQIVLDIFETAARLVVRPHSALHHLPAAGVLEVIIRRNAFPFAICVPTILLLWDR